MTQMHARRLSEQDLAQLYLQTEAPLRLDDLLQGKAEGDRAQIAVHDAIAGQTPDLALISLSLCALIIARDFPPALKDDGPAGPVLREMIVAAEDNLLTVGRLWLDSVCHGIAPDKADRELIKTIPDRLRILTSIYMELRDLLGGHADKPMREAVKSLYYQCESHADLADRFVDELTRAARARKPRAAAAAGTGQAAEPRRRPDQIPLPFDLVRPREGAEVVAFSLFHQKRGERH